MKVTKFGGSSLADAPQIMKVCDIVLSDPARNIVVVSAPGKRFSNDIKVTDLLINVVNDKLNGGSGEEALNKVISRFSDIAEKLKVPQVVSEIQEKISRIANAEYSSDNELLDSVKAMGEDSSAKIVAAYINSLGRKAVYCDPAECGLYLEHDKMGKAVILPETYDNLAKLADDEDTIKVFPGFYGYSKEGRIITFSRGGSDITGSILAAAVKADIYENWTDVDSVFAVNPNLVKNPFPIKEITYNEMRELSYAGFTVLHEEALYPVFIRNIPINIKNTNNPQAQGTMIVKSRTHFESLITGIAGKKGFCTVTINKYLMNRQVGFLASVFRIFEEEGVSIEHIPSGIDTITVIVTKKQFTDEKEDRILSRINNELGVDSISVEKDLAIVMIVGEAMANSVGIMARAATALSNAGINLRIVDQGASEISMMFGVSESYCEYAERVLYKELFRY